MMRHRPTERKAVIALLEQEWDDVADLAEALLDELMELKWGRGGWVIVVRHAGTTPFYTAHGPYSTENQAVKDIGRRVTTFASGGRGMPLKVTDMDSIEPQEGLW